MPLNRQPLPLEPDPQSVRAARSWVSDILQRLGRDDLISSAVLGVSELVTNAILHAAPPITVRVRGTRAHPRVEVRDHSQRPPEVNVQMTDEENLLSTIGRGLGIVALFSATWGAEVAPDGKSVWFEPSPDVRSDGDLSGAVFDFAEFVGRRLERPVSGPLLPIRLLDMPVNLFAAVRTRYSELRRELSLLALAHGDDYPIAGEIAAIFVQVEQERRAARGVEALDEALAEGRDRVDLEYLVPASTPATMARLLVLLQEADRFCREQRLLALAATPQQQAVQEWYLGEFIRQGAGERPRPWTGGFVLEDDPASIR